MYIYFDETTIGSNDEISGYGCIVVEAEIRQDIIEEALSNLEQDEDRHKSKFKKPDSRTLDRGLFHASEDTQNAHSHLCHAINNNIIGDFRAQLYNKELCKDIKETLDAYSVAAGDIFLPALSQPKKLHLVFEERPGLTVSLLEEWWHDLWIELCLSTHNLPFIPLYYPDISFEIRPKNDPGLQVVDFILWAAGRKSLGKRCAWFDRILKSITFETGPVDGSWKSISIPLGISKKVTNNESPYSVEDYERVEDGSRDRLRLYIVDVQQLINRVYSSGLNKSVSHFWDEIEAVAHGRLKKGSCEDIQRIANCFLKLFDNVGVIDVDMTREDKAFWLSCRKCMAYTLFKHQVQGMLHAMNLSKLRNDLIEHQSIRLDYTK